MDAKEIIEAFRAPSRLWTRGELTTRPSPIPPANGIYGWYFDELPSPGIPDIGTIVGPWALLYIGIAPGSPGSASNLRKRLRNHLTGNARGSTLRLTLGCLLAERLGISPFVASGKLHFGEAESNLSAWLDVHARVTWVEHPEPWSVEADVVRGLGVPLNRAHNDAHAFYPVVGDARKRMRDQLR